MTVEKWRDRFDNNIEAWRFLITQNQNLQEEATYMRCPKGQLLFQQIFFSPKPISPDFKLSSTDFELSKNFWTKLS